MANSLTGSGLTVGTAPAGTSTISAIYDLTGGGGPICFGSNTTSSTNTIYYTTNKYYVTVDGRETVTLPSVSVGQGRGFEVYQQDDGSTVTIRYPSAGSYRGQGSGNTSDAGSVSVTIQTGYTSNSDHLGYTSGSSISSSSGGNTGTGGSVLGYSYTTRFYGEYVRIS